MIFIKKKIFVLGSGSFGTAMANLWHQTDYEVCLWGRDANIISEIQNQKTNSKYLPDCTLENFIATNSLNDLTPDYDYVVFAVPTQNLRSVLEHVQNVLPQQAVFVNLAKGLEQKTLLWPHQIFCDVLGDACAKRVLSLSGPTFSKELLDGDPTAAVLAGLDQNILKKAQADLSLKNFRLYSSDDQLGVEIAGAIKNIYAIAVGVLEGLGFGHNSKASFMTRCLAEMIRFGVALGANAQTFAGLSGVGDLILTCTGHLSRNRQVGVRLGKGESLPDILSSMHSVAEGVKTAQSVAELLKSSQTLKNLDLPNLFYTYQILSEEMTLAEAMHALLSRPLKDEI